MSKMKITKITKTYEQVVSIDFNSWKFGTKLEAEVEISTPEELSEKSQKLFNNVKVLTQEDASETLKEIRK